MASTEDLGVCNYASYKKREATLTIKTMSPSERQHALEMIQAHCLISDPNMSEMKRIIGLLQEDGRPSQSL